MTEASETLLNKAFEHWLQEQRETTTEIITINNNAYVSKVSFEAGYQAMLSILRSEAAINVMAKAIAVSAYHEHGLETMNYNGEHDYAEKESHFYIDEATAARDALVKLMTEGV